MEKLPRSVKRDTRVSSWRQTPYSDCEISIAIFFAAFLHLVASFLPIASKERTKSKRDRATDRFLGDGRILRTCYGAFFAFLNHVSIYPLAKTFRFANCALLDDEVENCLS